MTPRPSAFTQEESPPLLTSLDARDLARMHGDRLALSCGSDSLTYEELAVRVEHHRETLSSSAGPCALLATPTLDALVVLHACLTFGRPVLLLPPNSPPALRTSFVERTGATLCYSVDGFTHHRTSAPAEPADELDHVLLPTSGTTGEPKIVCLSQTALLASARASNALLGLKSGGRWALTLPYAHVGGLAILVRCALAGAAALAKGYSLREKKSMRELEADSITHLSLVPTQLSRMLESEVECPRGLQAVLVGGASCPPRLRIRAREAGWPVAFTYGFTEAASQICTQELGRASGAAIERDVGRPLPGTQVALDGSGRISVRGPTLMNRYWGCPPRADDEWFVTQDFGHWDESDRLVIRGRADNMIISGGENVAAERVEESLLALPSVREAVVFGLDDAEWGQRIAALLVGEILSLDELRAALRGDLEPYALPKEIYFCEALPRLENGKLSRETAKSLLLGIRASQAIDRPKDNGKVDP